MHEQLEARLKDSRTVERLRNWGHVLWCVSSADHYLHRMETLPAKPTMESILEIDGLVLAFTITYGRVFAGVGAGFPRLEAGSIYKTEGLLESHHRIINLRNKRYAHSDHNDTMEYQVARTFNGTVLELKPKIGLGIPGNEFPAWRDVVNALQAYVHEKVHVMVERCSAELGIKCVFPSGEPPQHHR